VQVAAREGAVTLTRRGERKSLLTLTPLVGAPFGPSAFEHRDFDLTLDMAGPRAVVRMAAETANAPGLYLRGELSFSANGISDLAYWLENRGDEAHQRSVRVAMRRGAEGGMILLPLESGLSRAPVAEFPVGRSDGPLAASAFAEPWFGWEESDDVLGVAWGASARYVGFDYRTTVDGPVAHLAPGERLEPLRLALLAGDGGWRSLRAALLRWAGRPAGEAPVEHGKQWVRLGPRWMPHPGRRRDLAIGGGQRLFAAPERASAGIICSDGLTAETRRDGGGELIRASPLPGR
jgi:hypothetical protein